MDKSKGGDNKLIIGLAMIAVGLVLVYWTRNWYCILKDSTVSRAERCGILGTNFIVLIAALALIFGGFELISNDLFWMFF